MKKTFILKGLDCANCAAKIERNVSKIDGISEASVNFMTTKLSIETDAANIDGIVEAIEKVVKKTDSSVAVKAV